MMLLTDSDLWTVFNGELTKGLSKTGHSSTVDKFLVHLIPVSEEDIGRGRQEM